MNNLKNKEKVKSLTKEQIENILHMTGLSRKKIPFRNYYNSGKVRKNALVELVDRGLMRERVCSLSGYNYHLTVNGFEYIFQNRQIFNYDKRFKSAKALYKRAVC